MEAACRELEEADKAAAATLTRVPLGTLAPDMVRLDAEIKQITHAIRMAPATPKSPWPVPWMATTPAPRPGPR